MEGKRNKKGDERKNYTVMKRKVGAGKGGKEVGTEIKKKKGRGKNEWSKRITEVWREGRKE